MILGMGAAIHNGRSSRSSPAPVGRAYARIHVEHDAWRRSSAWLPAALWTLPGRSAAEPMQPSRCSPSTSSWKPSGSNMRSLPANQVLQGRIGYLLKRPVGRPLNEVRRFHANFSYQAATWTKPRRVITGSSGVRANCIRASACLLQQTRDVQAMDQGMQGRDQVDAAVVPDLCRKRGAASGSCACLQLPKNGSDMKQCIAAAALCLFATAANALVITPPNKQCDANSYVHKPLSPTHPLDPNSAAIVAGLNAQSPSSTSIRPTMPPRFSWSGISTRSSPIIKAPLLGSSPPRRN